MIKNPIFQRTRLLLGDEAVQALADARVIIFGMGGVGSWCAEALVRNGICHLTIVDNDTVDVSNINRQLAATMSTVGLPKVEAMRRRLLDINPEADILAVQAIYCEETAQDFHLEQYDYVIDAIDSLKDKIHLIVSASQIDGTRFFSSMGAALKMDPTRVQVANFWNVKCDPLARMLRKRIRQRRLMPERSFLCVYSDEMMQNHSDEGREKTASGSTTKAVTNGSLVHITAVFGMTLASLVVRDVVQIKSNC